MVSEGVDIPRLRVGVYATTVATELFFRQAVGRFVRWQSGRASQKAYVFLPDDPRLRAHAFQIADARRHVLRPPVEADDDPSPTSSERPRRRVAAARRRPSSCRCSACCPRSPPASDPRVHRDGLDVARRRAGPARADASDRRPLVDVELPDIPTELGYVAARAGQRRRAQGGAARAQRRPGPRARRPHRLDVRRVNAEMNRLIGITSVGAATNEQLERRAERADDWLRRGTPRAG